MGACSVLEPKSVVPVKTPNRMGGSARPKAAMSQKARVQHTVCEAHTCSSLMFLSDFQAGHNLSMDLQGDTMSGPDTIPEPDIVSESNPIARAKCNIRTRQWNIDCKLHYKTCSRHLSSACCVLLF